MPGTAKSYEGKQSRGKGRGVCVCCQFRQGSQGMPPGRGDISVMGKVPERNRTLSPLGQGGPQVCPGMAVPDPQTLPASQGGRRNPEEAFGEGGFGGGCKSPKLLFTTAVIGLFCVVRGGDCFVLRGLIVARRLAPTDRGRTGLPRTPSAAAGRAQRASPISPPIFRVD